ncbi:GerAB/ArcD/ProY family transporter [Heliobacterium chlorum]|uniref:GerAB/ArcD/ProY family transporter n=1 Tax=Heliobacterium chlorum TaxID=2698 RepID=A0ABR7T4X0_HELCL|nr:GerAB/ArcD/ProY family transporter [Heliobacterium chlorum]MBC9785716.1 GerAB/ArcD/ProY family transporter [Heliobacterium chlorum]
MNQKNSTKRQGYVGWIEASICIGSFVHVKMFLANPRELCQMAGTAAWMVPLIGVIGAIVIFFILNHLTATFSRASLLSIAGLFWGPTIQFLLGILFSSLFILISGYELRIFAEFVLTTLLPQTPISIVVISMVVLNIYLAIGGFESLSRTIMIIAPIGLTVLTLALTFGGTMGTVYNLSPWLGYGFWDTLSAGLLYTSLYEEIILLGFIAPLFREQKDFRRSGLATLVLSAVLFVFAQVVYEMCFQIQSAQQMGFPLFQVTRLIRFETFLQRLDPMFVFVWASVSSVGLAVGLYGAALTLTQGIRATDFRPYLIPLAVLSICVSFIPPRSLDAVNTYSFIPWLLQIPFYGLPVILLLWSKLFYRPQENRP